MPLGPPTDDELHEFGESGMPQAPLTAQQLNGVAANPAASSISGSYGPQNNPNIPRPYQPGTLGAPQQTLPQAPTQTLTPSPAVGPASAAMTDNDRRDQEDQMHAAAMATQQKQSNGILSALGGAQKSIQSAQQASQDTYNKLFGQSMTTPMPSVGQLKPPSAPTYQPPQVSLNAPQYQTPQPMGTTPQLLSQPGQLMSDRREKTEIKRASTLTRDFLDALYKKNKR